MEQKRLCRIKLSENVLQIESAEDRARVRVAGFDPVFAIAGVDHPVCEGNTGPLSDAVRTVMAADLA